MPDEPKHKLSLLGQTLVLVATVPVLLLSGCAGRGVTSGPAQEASPAADSAAQPSGGNQPDAGQQLDAGQRPYAGLQERPIRALAPERVADLLAGRGAGYALAAELNHHPGPLHVLEAATELDLRPEQEQATREIFAAMQGEAQELGRQLVDLEAELDRGFRAATLSEAELARLTGEIAAVEGRLRATHLAAHLQTKAILTPEQVARYDQVRGYTPADSDAPPANEQPSPEHTGPHTKHARP